MVKHLAVILIALVTTTVAAQSGTASPYSFYGIGSLKYKGTVENRSMGGIAVYLDSIHINLQNPAAYVGKNIEGSPYDSESRPVKFSVAGTHTNYNFKSNNASEKASSSVFDYIAISVPIGKFGFGFGILPYTSVGYNLQTFNDENKFENRFRGDGGVNRVFAGLGYKINDNLSFGVDVNYNFGSVQNSALAFAYTPEGDLVQYQTREDSRSDLSGLTYNFGVAYKTKITDKLELSTSFTYAPESKLTSNNKRAYSTIVINQTTGAETVRNTLEDDLESKNLAQTQLTLPSNMTLGTGIGQSKSWFVGGQYTFKSTSNYANPLYSNADISFENANEIALGGFYIPRYNAFSGYFKRVVYRAGFRAGNTGLIIKNEPINEFGISFGLGLPIGNPALFSNANLGFEFGQRGTTNQNLVKENFFNLNLSLSLNSRWFQKRKYN